ncbi:MAG: iron ABC transporter permease, partial [Actinomycetota bacterium]
MPVVQSLTPGPTLSALAISGVLFLFLVLPIGRVVFVAFSDGAGGFTLAHFLAFFQRGLFREAFYNSFYVAGISVVLASALAVPLAYLTVRFRFRGTLLLQTLGVLPLLMPPFVGAIALQLLFGRSGSINLILRQWLGLTVPIMDGLNGVIFVETIHYFPFILLNLSAAMSSIDGSMEEAAQNLGCHGLRLLRRVILPLAMPGYVAGATLMFVKVFDDLGTPLLLNVTNMLAPQAYLRISNIGLHDPSGYVISVIMVAFSVFALWAGQWALAGRDYATAQRGAAMQRRELKTGQLILSYAFLTLVLMVVLSPHIGVLLLAFSELWSFTVFPEGFTTAHFAHVVTDTPHYVVNTLWYCTLAALLDVTLGIAIAYVMLRTSLPGRQLLDSVASGALAIPGVVLGIGYLRTFYDVQAPFTDQPLSGTWFILVMALTIRRLPYALRSCVASLTQLHISMEEAAENCGAS